MKNEKMIEEMARTVCLGAKGGSCEECMRGSLIHFKECEWKTRVATDFYNAGYRKQSEAETLTKAHIQAHYEAIYALADMVSQFGYSTTFRKQKAVCDGGLSALEYAFGALLDCGCKMNSNGTITLKNLFAFQEEIQAKMESGE